MNLFLVFHNAHGAQARAFSGLPLPTDPDLGWGRPSFSRREMRKIKVLNSGVCAARQAPSSSLSPLHSVANSSESRKQKQGKRSEERRKKQGKKKPTLLVETKMKKKMMRTMSRKSRWIYALTVLFVAKLEVI
jgi:hypothetical protein